MKAWFVTGLVLCVLALGACSQSETTSDDAPAAGDPASAVGSDEADTAKRTNMANQAYKMPVMPDLPAEPEIDPVAINSGVGVLNPDFNDGITYWTLRSGPIPIKENAGAKTDPAMRMGPGYTYNFLSQDLVFDESPAGKTITLTALARTAEPEKAMIAIMLSDTQKFYSDKHPGDDQWRELTVTAKVPQDFEGNTVGIMLNHGGSPKKPAWFDHVRVQIR